MKERKRATTRTRRRKTRRILLTNGNRKRMKPGRKSHQRMVKSVRKKWANTFTTGVSTTRHGWLTSLLTACWVNSTRKNRGRSRRRPALLPLLQPLGRLKTLNLLPSGPQLPTWRNDVTLQHGCGCLRC